MWITEIEHRILLWIQESIRNPLLTAFFRIYTHMGDSGCLWILITLILFFPKQTRKTGFLCAGSLIGSLIIINAILKNVVGRVRPYETFTDLQLLIAKADDASFPSGHTGAAFACCWVIFRTQPAGFGIPTLTLAGLMGLSRLYVGIHYPSDVLFGALTGIAIGEEMVRLGRRAGKKRTVS